MDTKKIINKMSEQINVNDKKRELNDLKVLFNSLEMKICQFKQALKVERGLLKETESKLDIQLSKAESNAEDTFHENLEKLVINQKRALNNLNEAINMFNKAEKRLFGNSEEIKSLEKIKNENQKFYDNATIQLDEYYKKARVEFREIKSDILNGVIYPRKYEIFSISDINALNSILEEINELKKQIEQLENSIDDSIIERDKTAQKIVALNDNISTILTERELYKMTVELAAIKAKDKANQTVGEIVNGVEKGLKGASKVGKGLYTVAKQKADSYIQKLEEDGFTDQAEKNNSIEKNTENKISLSEKLEKMGFFGYDYDEEEPINEEPQTTDEKVDGCIDNIANAIGLNPETTENGKKLVKTILRNFNNDNKE